MNVFDPVGPLPRGVTLIEASAGTGKTYSITSLVLRLVVEQGLQVREILVVTFTRAATAEVRERIRTRLRQGLDLYDQVLSGQPPDTDDEVLSYLLGHSQRRGRVARHRELLRAALEDFDEAPIATIHGFCQQVLQRNAFESGVDFDVELVEDIDPLLTEVVQDLWTEAVHDAPLAWLRALRNDRVGLARLKDLAAKVIATPDLSLVPPPPPDPGGLEAAGQAWQAAARELWQQWQADAPRALSLLRDARDNKQLSRDKYRENWLSSRYAKVDAWLAQEPTAGDGVEQKLQWFTRGTLDRWALPAGSPVLLPPLPLFDAAQALWDRDQALEPLLQARTLGLLHRVAGQAADRLAGRKRTARVLSFDDLLLLLREGLRHPQRGPRLREVIRARFKAGLIDEFQDTDPVQWEIFHRALGGGDRWLLLIGDPKQAIYSFRGADIFTYRRARKEADRESQLDVNWRSDRPLVEAVNQLFSPARVPEPFVYDWIRYHPVQAHHQKARLILADPAGGGHQPAPPLQVRLVPRDGAPLAGGSYWGLAKPWAWRTLPRVVAADITRLLASDPLLSTDDGPRPLRPADVALLVRSHKQAAALQRALREVGLHSVLRADRSVLDSPEADELLALLAATLEPARAGQVRAALATDLVGLPASELARMEIDEAAWEGWLERLRSWRELWHSRGFYPMFRRLLTEQRLPERLLGWTDGERRMTNLLHLAELLHGAASGQRLSPAGLLGWLREQRQRPDQRQEQRLLRLESDADALEIVTMHGCKGLEYPVVFCPYLWDGPRPHKDEDQNLRFDDDGPHLDLSLDPGAEPKRSNKLRAAEERRAESLRLAYVALTRPRHQCTIYWGWFNGCHGSPLAHLLFPAAGPESAKQTSARFKKFSDQQMEQQLQELAAASGGTLAVSRVDPAAPPLPAPAPPAPPELTARTFARKPFDSLWRRSSFTGMTRGGRSPAPSQEALARRDVDAVVQPPDPPQLPAAQQQPGPPVPLARLPGGPGTGLLLHRVLELHDFTSGRQPLLELLERHLPRHELAPEAWAEPLADALQAGLSEPLGGDAGGLCLAQVPLPARLNELDFDLPLAGGLHPRGPAALLTPPALQQVLERHQGADPAWPADYPARIGRLPFAPLRGFLTGSIDLAFRHQQRFYIVDYKSNQLGPRPEDYDQGRLREAMAHGHYYLQYLLYAVALGRYLVARIPDYDHQRHFGGVYYLFLRGLGVAGPPGCGVFHHRPSAGLMRALDALLDRGAGGGP